MQRGRVDRVTALFSRVHPGEGLPVVILLVDLFILLGGGAAVKSYAAAGQAMLLVALVPAYGWSASRVPRVGREYKRCHRAARPAAAGGAPTPMGGRGYADVRA